ncbi:MAG: hypothetical protein EOO90_15205 [Pedobacter sp.]|nr:MAG: hypothetical protein EOO90_15205 [Pedobacter sp.]
MAKLTKGIIGPLLGKLGPIIGSSWKGKAYIKTSKTEATPSKPSIAQKGHTDKFRFMTRWLRPIHPYLAAGFRNLAADPVTSSMKR